MFNLLRMKRATGAVLAAAFILALPLAASAQAVETWRFGKSSEDPGRRHLRLRPVIHVEDSEQDLELRLESLRKCALLSEIKARTILDEIAGAPNVLMD